ncbi:hypothetical protein [Enterococcus sp. AZ192]|uniref:CdiA C-terminal domain-containing protein n=1 Tax=unclassified Enterococcus TaxID=2608891 RepID=UPI003D2743C3
MEKRGFKVILLLVVMVVITGQLSSVVQAVEVINEQLKLQTVMISKGETSVGKPSKEWLLSELQDETLIEKELMIAEPVTLFVQGEESREDVLFPVLFRNQVFQLVRWNSVSKEYSLETSNTAQGLNSFMNIATTEAPLVLFEKAGIVFVRHRTNVYSLSDPYIKLEQLEAVKNEYLSFQFPTTETINIFQSDEANMMGKTTETEFTTEDLQESMSEAAELEISTESSTSSQILESSTTESGKKDEVIVESKAIENQEPQSGKTDSSEKETLPSRSQRAIIKDYEGDTIEDAKLFDMEYSGSIDFADDTDWLKVEVPETGKYEINISSTIEINFSFYGSSGDTTIAWDTSIKNQKIVKDLTKGTYYFKLKAPNFKFMGIYNVKLVQLESQEGDKEGNTYSEATLVDLNYTGAIDYDSDRDWLKFVITSSGTYELKVNSESPLYYNLYGSSGELSLINKQATKEFTQKLILTKGTYYHSLGRYYLNNKGKYEIKVTQLDSHEDDKEGDKLEKATSIGLTYAGGIDYEQDKDWVKFNITSSGTYEVKVISEIPLYYRLYGSSGTNEIIYQNGTKEVIKKMTLNKGTYYHYLGGYNSKDKGKYEISVTQLDKHDDDKEANFLERATLVDLNYTGAIDYEQDKDWLKVTIVSSGTYEVKVISEIPLYYRLYGSSGTNEIIYQNGTKEVIKKMTLNKGTYYHYFGGYNSKDKGKYEISVTQLDKHDDDKEANFLERATLVDLNYTGAIDYEQDKDWLKVTIVSSGTYEVKVTSEIPLYYRLYGSSGTNEIVYQNGTKEVIKKMTLNKGTYYHYLQGYNSKDKGKYEINITQLDRQDDDKEANLIERATLVDLNYTGAIDYEQDKDWLKFTVASSGTYEVKITGEIPLYYSLYGSSGTNEIVYQNGTKEIIKKTTLNKGTYYHYLRGYNSKDKGKYEINITQLDRQDDDKEANLIERATPIGLNYTGAIDYEQDKDWLKFTIASSGTYEVKIIGEIPLYYSLYGSSGTNEIVYQNGTKEVIKKTTLNKGTYYHYLRGYNSADKGNYAVSIKQIDSQEDDLFQLKLNAATQIEPNQTKSIIGEQDTPLYWKILIKNAGEYTFTGSQGAYLTIYDDSGKRVLSSSSLGVGKLKCMPGTYFVSTHYVRYLEAPPIYSLSVETLIDYTKDDVGNTPDTAKQIEIKTPFKGKINYTDDIDYLKFTITNLGEYEISTESRTTKMYSYLYDDSGVRNLVNGTYDKIKRKLYPGTYYLAVKNTDSSTKEADYTIAVTTIKDYTKDDVGNTPDTAKQIEIKTPFKGKIDYTDDIDYVKFTVTNLGEYEISTESRTTKMYSYLYDDSGVRNLVNGTYDKIKRKLYPGAYYLAVKNTDSGTKEADYTIEIKTLKDYTKDDVGNTPDTAKQIEIKTPFKGKINYTDDIDYLKFTITNLGEYEISTESRTTKMYSYLYDDSGVRNLVNGTYDKIKRKLYPGTYYLAVKNTDSGTKEADYTVEIKTLKDYTKDDIGNTPDTAKQIEIKTPFKGKINYTDDIDYLKFTVTNLGEYEISTESRTTKMYSYLYDDSGVRNLVNGTYGKIKCKLYPGTYYLAVKNTDSAIKEADYEIQIKILNDYTKDDAGNGPKEARLIKINTPFKGKIDYENDIDYLKFTITNLGEYEISVKSETTSMYNYLYDDSGVRSIVSGTSNKIKRKFYPGTYYLAVKNTDSAVKQAEYTVDITTTIDYTKDEAGDTPKTAAALVLNKDFSGQFDYIGDIDFYKLTISKAGTYYLSGDSKITSLQATLYDDSGIRKISDQSNSHFVFKRKLIPGTYYLKLRTLADEKGKYILRSGVDDVGDNFDTAKSIKLNQLYNQRLDHPGDVDFYKLDLKKDELATYCEMNFSSETNIKYTLYDGNKKEYVSSDGAEKLSKLLVPDIYYLKIEGKTIQDFGNYAYQTRIGDLSSDDIDIVPYRLTGAYTMYYVYVKDELDQKLTNIYTTLIQRKNWEDIKSNLSKTIDGLGNLLNQVVQLAGPTIGTGTAAVGVMTIQGSYSGLVLAEVGVVAGATAVSGGTVLLVIGATGLVGLMIANSSGEIEKPQIRQDYSNWQDKGIKPSKEKGGKPRGEYEEGSGEGIKRQNDTANHLADEGYDLEMLEYNPEGNGHGIKPESSPDFKIEGKVFDCYAPTTNNTKNLVNEIVGKTKGQADKIVLNLDGYSTNKVNEILGMIQRKANPNGDLKRLTEILVTKDKKIIWKWTW